MNGSNLLKVGNLLKCDTITTSHFPDPNHTIDWTNQAVDGTTFTAPADGWIEAKGSISGANMNYNGGIYGNNWMIPIGLYGSQQMAGGGRVQVYKGETISVSKPANCNISYLGFIYPKQ